MTAAALEVLEELVSVLSDPDSNWNVALGDYDAAQALEKRLSEVLAKAKTVLATNGPGKFSELLTTAKDFGAFAVEFRVCFDPTVDPTKRWRVRVRDRHWHDMGLGGESQSGEGALAEAVGGLRKR